MFTIPLTFTDLSNAASGRAVSGRAENRRVVPSNPASGEDDADAAEVIRISIPSPKLTIPVDGKPIISHVLDMFPGWDDVVFVVNEEHLDVKSWNLVNNEVTLK